MGGDDVAHGVLEAADGDLDEGEDLMLGEVGQPGVPPISSMISAISLTVARMAAFSCSVRSTMADDLHALIQKKR